MEQAHQKLVELQVTSEDLRSAAPDIGRSFWWPLAYAVFVAAPCCAPVEIGVWERRVPCLGPTELPQRRSLPVPKMGGWHCPRSSRGQKPRAHVVVTLWVHNSSASTFVQMPIPSEWKWTWTSSLASLASSDPCEPTFSQMLASSTPSDPMGWMV